MSYKEHKTQSTPNVKCSVLTVSDTRTKEDDESGKLIVRLLKDLSHVVSSYDVIKDESEEIKKFIVNQIRSDLTQAVIINGGTGISRRDVTFEVVNDLLEKKLDGFGEIFRHLSFQEIGSPAMMSRALAGIYQGKAIFSIPGSVEAVRLAMERLILPELGHIVTLLNK